MRIEISETEKPEISKIKQKKTGKTNGYAQSVKNQNRLSVVE